MNRWTLFVNREPSFVWANSSHFETRIKRVPEYVHTTRNVSHVRTCFFMLLWQRWCFFLCLPGMTFQMPAPALTFQTSKSNGTPKSLLIILCVQKINIYIYIIYLHILLYIYTLIWILLIFNSDHLIPSHTSHGSTYYPNCVFPWPIDTKKHGGPCKMLRVHEELFIAASIFFKDVFSSSAPVTSSG